MIKKTRSIFCLTFALASAAFSQSSLNCDFSNSENKRNKTFNFWDIENKIFSGPITTVEKSEVDNGGRARNLNFVRTLGGWRKVENGVPAKDYSGDLARFEDGEYVFDASKMINKLKQYRRNGVRINQIVLDNPPWVFQRGLNFVTTRNNVDYLKSTEIETYGNAIPPNDNYRWRRFIRFVMKALVDEFGESTVEKWRFRAGSEIETSGHWAGTKEQYFRHYRIIAEEVKKTVPNAEVGVHLREASFSSEKLNYKGQKIQSFGKEFISWAKSNDVPYDFMGVSYYPFFDRLDGGLGGLDVFKYYDEGIKPLTESKDFNKNASVEIHEFWLFTNFGNGLLVNVGTSHGSAFFIKLARLAYERGIKKINQWGYGKIGRLLSPQRMAMKLLRGIEGQDRYRYKSDIKTKNNNTIDAIFTTTGKGDGRRYNAIVSNYSSVPEYATEKEKVVVSMQLPVATGKNYEYRIITYGKDQCAFNLLKDVNTNYKTTQSNGGWLKNGVNATYGHISKAMGGSGSVKRNRLAQLETDANKLQNYNNFQATPWVAGSTKNIEGSSNRSRFTEVLNLESFMIKKIEVRLRSGNINSRNRKSISSESFINVYPNPASSNFNIEMEGIDKAKVFVYDMLGKIVLEEFITEENTNFLTKNMFKQGMYFVKIIADNEEVYKTKLIVN